MTSEMVVVRFTTKGRRARSAYLPLPAGADPVEAGRNYCSANELKFVSVGPSADNGQELQGTESIREMVTGLVKETLAKSFVAAVRALGVSDSEPKARRQYTRRSDKRTGTRKQTRRYCPHCRKWLMRSSQGHAGHKNYCKDPTAWRKKYLPHLAWGPKARTAKLARARSMTLVNA